MDIMKENGITAVRLDSSERAVVQRAVTAHIVKLAEETIGRAARDIKEPNERVLGLAALHERLSGNAAPVSAQVVENGLSLKTGEEGYTLLEQNEVVNLRDTLRLYSDNTVLSIANSLSSDRPFDRAGYGLQAERLQQQLSDTIE